MPLINRSNSDNASERSSVASHVDESLVLQAVAHIVFQHLLFYNFVLYSEVVNLTVRPFPTMTLLFGVSNLNVVVNNSLWHESKQT